MPQVSLVKSLLTCQMTAAGLNRLGRLDGEKTLPRFLHRRYESEELLWRNGLEPRHSEDRLLIDEIVQKLFANPDKPVICSAKRLSAQGSNVGKGLFVSAIVGQLGKSLLLFDRAFV